MNILLDLLPYTVQIGDVEYPINTDFRISILFELMMQDDSLSDNEKIKEALVLYYPQIPHDIHEAVDKMIWFYRCGKVSKPGRTHADSEDGDTQERLIYSFEHDDNYIYAAFLSEYGIDLQDIEELHWWKFRAMFLALNENCEFKKIMGYRSVRISGKMSQEQREFYQKMQRIHALPISNDEQKKYDAITKALMGDGDLTGLL
ncbi:MAG: bacteriophage Gp15 family protein [Blautia sp.]